MQVTFYIPVAGSAAFAAQLTAAGQNPARSALEALALEGYRSRQLSEAEVLRLLGYTTRMEVHAFLADHAVPLHYTEEHLRQDIAASDKLHAQRAPTAAHA